MKKFFKLDGSEVQKMSIQECGEKMTDITKENANIVVATKKDYSQIISFPCSSFVRKSVMDKLSQAQKHLPNGIKFKILEGYRPISVQKMLFEERKERLAKKHPEWDEKHLSQETALFIAPWNNTPPHSTGGAFDLTLITDRGEELDMGTDLDEVYADIFDDACFTDAEVSQKARENRKILMSVLLKEGFVNYPAEWWHWSYGDRYWALLNKKPHAIYGSAEVPTKE